MAGEVVIQNIVFKVKPDNFIRRPNLFILLTPLQTQNNFWSPAVTTVAKTNKMFFRIKGKSAFKQ
mgnify:CR=1 FL=1